MIIETSKMITSTENIPTSTGGELSPNCPIDYSIETDPIELADRAENHALELVSTGALSLELARPTVDMSEAAAGQLACEDCVLRVDCIDSTQETFNAYDIVHPVEIGEQLTSAEQDRLQVLASLSRIDRLGITEESSREVIGELLKSPELTRIAAEILAADEDAVVESAGSVELQGAKYSVIGISGVLVAVHERTLSSNGLNAEGSETLDYWTDMLKKDTDSKGNNTALLLRCMRSEIRTARNFLTLLSGVNSIYEFRPNGGDSKNRMFGKIADSRSVSEKSNGSIKEESVVIVNRIQDSKTGDGGKATRRHAEATSKALKYSSEELVSEIVSCPDIKRIVERK